MDKQLSAFLGFPAVFSLSSWFAKFFYFLLCGLTRVKQGYRGLTRVNGARICIKNPVSRGASARAIREGSEGREANSVGTVALRRPKKATESDGKRK